VDAPSSEIEAREFIEKYRPLLGTPLDQLQNNADFDLSRDALRMEIAATLTPLAEAKVKFAALRLKRSLWDAYADTLEGKSDLVRQWGKNPHDRLSEAEEASDETAALVNQLEADEEVRAAVALLAVFTWTEAPGTQG
jgi:hypothetical protein